MQLTHASHGQLSVKLPEENVLSAVTAWVDERLRSLVDGGQVGCSLRCDRAGTWLVVDVHNMLYWERVMAATMLEG